TVFIEGRVSRRGATQIPDTHLRAVLSQMATIAPSSSASHFTASATLDSRSPTLPQQMSLLSFRYVHVNVSNFEDKAGNEGAAAQCTNGYHTNVSTTPLILCNSPFWLL